MSTPKNTGLTKPIPTAWQQPIDDYLRLQTAAGRPAGTIYTRRYHLARFARAMRCAPAAVDAERMVVWFSRQTQWSVETRRSYRTTLRSFYAWAQSSGLVTVNIGLALPRMKPLKRTPRPAPDMAVRVAMAVADPRTRVMVRLAAEVGMRRAEVAQCHTADLICGTYGPQLVVHGKGNKDRLVPISDNLAATIRAGAAGHTPGAPAKGYLFPGTYADGYLSPRWVGKLMSDALPDEWTAHTLRHRFATRAYRGTRNLRAVQMLLGHESIVTTEIYTAVDDHEMRAAMLAAISESPAPQEF